MYKKVYVSMPSLRDRNYAQNVALTIEDENEEVLLVVDWHYNVGGYHMPPPHYRAISGGGRIGDEGLGYAPFGWVKGWIWMREQLVKLLELAPEAIMYGVDPHIRNGWGFLNNASEPDVAFYNDTLGILREVLDESDYQPEYLVIPETPGSNIQSRGIKRAKEFARFIDVVAERDFKYGDEEPADPVVDDTEDEEDIYWGSVQTYCSGHEHIVETLKDARKNLKRGYILQAKNGITKAIKMLEA